MIQAQPVIALGSCAASAIMIATNTLVFGLPRNRFDIVHKPLSPNRLGFGDMKSVIFSSFETARSLFKATEHARLSICLTQEVVTQKATSRVGETFTVAMISAYCKRGPLSAYYADEWVPKDRLAEWYEAIQDAGSELMTDQEPPGGLVQQAADKIAGAFIQGLVLPDIFQFTAVH
jgi:hypothetical protein